MVAGPSGAGKSTLFRDVLGPAAECAIKARKQAITGAEFSRLSREPGRRFRDLRNLGGLRSVVEVDQSPIGKTPRSTPATYLGIFDLVRAFFASLPESKIRGYTASRFSFNTQGGRCPTCEGAGPHPPGDGVHARHLPAVRRLPGHALRAGALRRNLEGPLHRRRSFS